MSKINRRDALRLLGIGVISAGAGSLALRAGRPTVRVPSLTGKTGSGRRVGRLATPAGAPGAGAAEASALVTPFEPGTKMATSRITRIRPATTGAVSLDLCDARGRPYRVEICRRDDRAGAPAPVRRTKDFDLFLANGGQGQKRTDRNQGLAVAAIAATLERSGRGPSELGLLTMRERWTRYDRTELSAG